MSDSLENLLKNISEQIKFEKRRLEELITKFNSDDEDEHADEDEEKFVISDIKKADKVNTIPKVNLAFNAGNTSTDINTKEIEKLDTIEYNSPQTEPVISNTPRKETMNIVGILYSSRRKKNKAKIIECLRYTRIFQELNIIIFTIEGINLEDGTVKGDLYTKTSNKTTEVPIPSLIYNLILHSKKSSRTVIRQLRTSSNIKMINPINSFYQDAIYEILFSLPEARKYLLPFKPLSPANLKDFLNQYKNIALIQNRSYRHPQAISLRKNTDSKLFLKIGQSEQIVDEDEVLYIIQKLYRNKRFNILKGIESLKFNNLPAEYRVYVQRNEFGKWKVTSSVIKNEIFSKGSLYNNQAKNIDDALFDIDENIIAKINNSTKNASLLFTSYLDYFIPNTGCYYIDYLLDKNGKPYLLYIGGVEQSNYLSLSNNKDWDIYLENILSYLYFCLGEIKQTGSDENVD
ncbi:MAG: hypothetical protein K0S34_594 [Bacillales bacterium]|jgi:hypothetical protein|nr:hypothetical protein [Bacillales bacterium]